MKLNLDLKGQIALVTGASRGIGRKIALELGTCGATVIAVARNGGLLRKLCHEISEAGGEGIPVKADFSDCDQVLYPFNLLDERYSGKLDILINNAGIGLFGSIVDFSVDDWDRVMNVNLRSAFVCCREAVRRMAPAWRGYIINISSVVGFKGYVNQGAYTASKHGIVGLTKTLAAEVQEHNIKVSVICPGGVNTDMVGEARPDLDRSELLQPEDIARTVLYLLSLPPGAVVDMIYLRRSGSKPF